MTSTHFSIRRYLTSHVLFWVVLMTVLPIVWVYWDAKHEVDELFDASLVQSARVLHGLLNRDAVENSHAHLTQSLQHKDLGLGRFSWREYTEEGHLYEKKVAFQIWNPDGTLVIKSASAPQQPLAELTKGYADGGIGDYDWNTFALFSDHDQWWVIVGERDDIREEIMTDIIHGHVWPLLLITPLLAWITWVLIGKSLAPLHRLSRQLNQRDYQDLNELDKRQSPQETLELVNAMNSLFQRLNQAYQRESRFSGDAAHELRNPLASLMIHTENALEDNQYHLQHSPQQLDPTLTEHLQQQQADLGMIRQSISRLSHIVQQLLALSRAETQQQSAKSDCDLVELCQESIHFHQPQAQQKSQQIELMAAGVCPLRANQALLLSLLNNLLNNAINYTPEHGTVRLSCSMQNAQVFLTVEDSGLGIPAAERERVKDRFYRLSGNKAYGVGLGLSIVQAIIERHEASWELGESELGGLAIHIVFPE